MKKLPNLEVSFLFQITNHKGLLGILAIIPNKSYFFRLTNLRFRRTGKSIPKIDAEIDITQSVLGKFDLIENQNNVFFLEIFLQTHEVFFRHIFIENHGYDFLMGCKRHHPKKEQR